MKNIKDSNLVLGKYYLTQIPNYIVDKFKKPIDIGDIPKEDIDSIAIAWIEEFKKTAIKRSLLR